MRKRFTPNRDLDRLLARQDRLLTRAQAIEHGVSRTVIGRRLADRSWRRLLPQVYLTVTGWPYVRQLMRAGLLYAGPLAALDGVTVLQVSGLRYAPQDSRIHVVVPHERRIVSREFVVVHRALHVDSTTEGADVPRIGVALALARAAPDLGSLRATRAVTAEAVQRGLVRIPEVERALTVVRRNGTANLRRSLDDLRAGCRSAPEAEFRDLVRTSRLLPEPRWNQWLATEDGTVLGCADGYWEKAALVHEVDSRDAHAWSVAAARTQDRHNRLTAAGLAVLHTLPTEIRTQSAAVMDRVEAAYRQGRLRGPARGVRCVPAPTWADHR